MGQHRFFFPLPIPPHFVVHVTQTQADERGGGGEKTGRKGEEEKRKLVKTNAGSWPKKTGWGAKPIR